MAMLSLSSIFSWWVVLVTARIFTAAQPSKTIVKDVAIIGGGASGAYAAVRLRDDYDKSIALIEMQGSLGGMVNTYIDPKTRTPYDYGVQSFLDIGNASAFFDRFGVERSAVTQTNTTTKYIDFTSGAPVNLTLPSFDSQVAAMKQFLEVVKPWTDYLQPGYWNFPAPDNIPEDFLIPYGEFITKYGLEDAVPIIYESTGLGLGNMTHETTMFVLQAFGTYMAEAIVGEIDSYHPATGGNQALYNAIEQDLGDDVLYHSTVLHSSRTDSGVTLTVQNHLNGSKTEIHAQQLLIAIEPTAFNTAPFDLDDNEKTVLSKFIYTNEYSGIINNPAFVAPMSYANMAPGAAPDHYLVLPESSFTNTISYIGGDNLFHVIIIGNDTLDENGAKALLQENFETLLKAGRLGEPYKGQQINWVDFSVHGPMHARVSPEDVKAGFFQDLYALQGQRSTWWTGGAFACNFQTTLWEFDEILIPKILANLS